MDQQKLQGLLTAISELPKTTDISTWIAHVTNDDRLHAYQCIPDWHVIVVATLIHQYGLMGPRLLSSALACNKCALTVCDCDCAPGLPKPPVDTPADPPDPELPAVPPPVVTGGCTIIVPESETYNGEKTDVY